MGSRDSLWVSESTTTIVQVVFLCCFKIPFPFMVSRVEFVEIMVQKISELLNGWKNTEDWNEGHIFGDRKSEVIAHLFFLAHI